jgi:DNA-binding NarL/FixJ family response regulator
LATRTRVLVVDDYEPFRRFTCSMLKRRPELQVVGELSDGWVAVQTAQELQPELIVLDLGLPTLNGIEAARRIRKLSPESTILFVSQESSPDVVQEALAVGAMGYVLKTHAGTELLAAVDAVLQGKAFLSSGLSGTHLLVAQSLDHGRKETLLTLVPRKVGLTRKHEVHFYADDASFLVGFTEFIENALNAGNAVIAVATESHQKALFQRLQAQGVNIGAALEQGRYVALDVAETLSTFMGTDLPDTVRFLKVAGDLVAAAARATKGEHPRVAACGECAPVLWAQGNVDGAIQLEHLWDEIAKTHDVDILCGYVLTSFQREQEGDIYEKICAEHSTVCSQ